MALCEANSPALWLGALLLPLAPASVSFRWRLLLVLASGLALAFGAPVLLLGAPAALALAGFASPALATAALLAGSTLLYPQLQSVPHGPGTIPLASFAFLALTAWVPLAAFARELSWRSRVALFGLPLALMLLLDLMAGRWIGPSGFTHPLVRLLLALAPAFVAAWDAPLVPRRAHSWLAGFLAAAALGALSVITMTTSPLREVVFDEAHGKWETVKASFAPEDFGRSANYTYSQLFVKARKLVGRSSTFDHESQGLPETDALFIIKMPAEPLSAPFGNHLQQWVAAGGRLLVVADHTDLYDTTQHINAFLGPRFGLRVNADATYNPIGMPAIPTTGVAQAALGRIDAHGRLSPWQTGASLQALPLTAVELATFGPSFAEPGDYSRPNRFGPFMPTLANRFMNHSAVVAAPFGKGAVAVVLDSTPWSNFSIFREQYSQLFRGIVYALEHPTALRVLGGGALLLALVGLIASWVPTQLAATLVGLALGATLAAGSLAGSVSWSSHLENRDFTLRVVVGPQARLEFLKQVIPPGERNYSRIVSAMGKYDLMPLASTPGTETAKLTTAKRWLLIEPSAEQLPSYQEVFNHLHSGGDLTIMFAPEQATKPEVWDWLDRWGLSTQRSIGLAIVDGIKSASGSFLGGRSPVLSREIRVVVTPRSNSLLNTYAADQFLQTFTLRPTKMPRESGLLTLSFAAEQFTDDAVGEVWEGIHPSSIGRLRERQLAAVLLGEERPPLMPNSLVRAQRRPTPLPAFMALENGEQKLSSKFGPVGEDDPTTAYFRALRDQAGEFIATRCPSTGKLTQCPVRFLGDDMIEWMVNWRSDDDGKPLAIELLHERRMSGLGSTWNVLFGK